MKTLAMTAAEWIKQHPIKIYKSGKFGWSKESAIFASPETAKLARKDAAKSYMCG